jgi:predicted glycoside hydrolase/deacetylase ChbG (UPF0249 family)
LGGARLIVNADDFGFTRDVNQGIVEAHRNGILTATTLMANGPAFDDAVWLARENTGLDVGCHLVLVQGQSIVDPARALPETVTDLVRSLARREIDVEAELAAQIRRILDAGIRPTHLDTHKHTHLLPPVLSAVTRLARQFGIPWIRRPFDFGIDRKAAATKRLVALAMRLAKPAFANALAGLRATDHFTGFQITGTLGLSRLLDVLERLPEGLTEFMCHPGRFGEELRAASTRLKESRAIELAALTSPEAQEVVERRGIVLTCYRDE